MFIILREEHKLQASENKVLRKIYGSKRDEVNEAFMTLHSYHGCIIYEGRKNVKTIKMYASDFSNESGIQTQGRTKVYNTNCGKTCVGKWKWNLNYQKSR